MSQVIRVETTAARNQLPADRESPRTLTIKVRASSVHGICRFFTVC